MPLLAVLKLEVIGDNYFAYRKFAQRPSPRYERNVYQMTKKSMRPWVARITGTDPQFGLAREFLQGQKDYSQANSVGSRGIYLYFPLKDGIYEVNERLTWKRTRRYFIRVEDAQTTEISREKVGEWLANTI